MAESDQEDVGTRLADAVDDGIVGKSLEGEEWRFVGPRHPKVRVSPGQLGRGLRGDSVPASEEEEPSTAALRQGGELGDQVGPGHAAGEGAAPDAGEPHHRGAIRDIETGLAQGLAHRSAAPGADQELEVDGAHLEQRCRAERSKDALGRLPQVNRIHRHSADVEPVSGRVGLVRPVHGDELCRGDKAEASGLRGSLGSLPPVGAEAASCHPQVGPHLRDEEARRGQQSPVRRGWGSRRSEPDDHVCDEQQGAGCPDAHGPERHRAGDPGGEADPATEDVHQHQQTERWDGQVDGRVQQRPAPSQHCCAEESGKTGSDEVEAPALPAHPLGGGRPAEARGRREHDRPGGEARPDAGEPEGDRVLEILGPGERVPGDALEQSSTEEHPVADQGAREPQGGSSPEPGSVEEKERGLAKWDRGARSVVQHEVFALDRLRPGHHGGLEPT